MFTKSSFPYNYLNRDILFGVVPVGTTVVKSHTIKNQYSETVAYVVTRNQNINPIYYVFDVNKYEAKIEPGREFLLKISFSPNIVGTKDFDYFTIRDSRHNVYRLNVRGECSGPLVNSSIRNLNFIKISENKNPQHIFTLTNNSECPAKYHFDCNEEEQGIFVVDPVRGVIKPQEHVYIEVKFCPPFKKNYSRQLSCLILHHEPILINLFGIYSDKYHKLDELTLHYYPFPHKETVSFAGFLSDSVTQKLVPPPISFTVNYLDFGQMKIGNTCQTLTTSFTNHMENKVEVEWEESQLFHIYPEKLEIPAKQAALYECRFQPDTECRLSWALIHGCVSWTRNEETNSDPFSINIPIPINLRFIGHSFPEKQAWIPSVSVSPNNVILPLCLPSFDTWTTFLIEAHGPLPVLFRLVPPLKTNFIMKPMVGLVRSFQIIVVQLETNSNEPNSYIEKWNIELNGHGGIIPIYVKAQTDTPRLVVGSENCIKFEPMQPGTQSSIYIPLRNLSSCHLQYEFSTLPYFGVESAKGILAPNEEIFVTCWYQSDFQEIGESEYLVNCRIQCIYRENILIGEGVDIPVRIFVDIVYSELCALPSVHQCGLVEYGTRIKTCFYIYNFGASNINYKLCHDHNLKDVELYPIVGICGPRQKLMIVVDFTINFLGKHSLHIGYNNRLSQFAADLTDEGAKYIFRIEYECNYAILQITDLVEHNLGELFSNDDLWYFLKINEINAALKETNKGEITRVDLCVPECEVSDKLYYLSFVIKNVSCFETKLHLKRKQICDCKQKQSNDSVTFRIKYFDCPHKDLFTMQIASSYFPAQSPQRLTFKIKHTIPDENILAYTFEMSNNRTVLLQIFVNSICPDFYTLSVYNLDYTLHLGFVYIGLREAPVLAFWLYNNTSNAVPYKLDDLEIIKLCNQDGFPVLKCLNTIGFIKPWSSAPLLFKFWPIEMKCYKVIVPLMLGMKPTVIVIEGYGTDQINKSNFKNFLNLVQKPLYNNVVSLSVDRLVIEPLLVGTSTERMFFIKNRDRHHRIQYEWKPCLVDGLIKVEVSNIDGFLKPQETQPVIINISSLNEPCSIRILLSCEFIDCDQLVIFNETLKLVNEKRRHSMKEFVITSEDDESENTEAEPDIELPPKPEYFTLTLPIIINVVGYEDRDNCLSIDAQMKQRPVDGVTIDVDKFVKKYFEENKEKDRPIRPLKEVTIEKSETVDELHIEAGVTKSVLEHLASDVVFSDYFREKLNIMKNEPCPLYSQIKIEGKYREQELEKQTKKSLTQPKLTDIVDISKEALTHGLEATFHLGPFPRKQEKGSSENS